MLYTCRVLLLQLQSDVNPLTGIYYGSSASNSTSHRVIAPLLTRGCLCPELLLVTVFALILTLLRDPRFPTQQ